MLTESPDQPTTTSESSTRYKYQRLRERLRLAISTGDLAGRLPGERELGRRYSANAKTINKALSDLTTEGLLVRHVGRGTFVANGDRLDVATWKRARVLGWIGPGDRNGAAAQTAFRQAERIIGEKGHSLAKIDPDVPAAAEIPEHAISPGELRELSGLILFSVRPSLGFLADLHRRHLPVVMANNGHAQIKTTTVVADYAQGTFELCQHLVQLGHQHIELLIGNHLLPAANVAAHAYRAAMQRHGLAPHSVGYVGEHFDWHSLVEGPDGPTALVCVGGAVAVSAVHQAVDAGVVVPDKLSIVALPEPGETAAADESITAYEVEPERIVHWATELLLSAAPGEPPRSVVVPGQLADRDSAGPPASREYVVCRAPEEIVV